MRLRVVVESSGAVIEVDVLPQIMVLAVKEIMALHTSIPVPCQQLWWRNILLEDASILKNVLPPMFFHASFDTITSDYYKLLGNTAADDDGNGDLDDLSRVKKEAFLTLKVVNPSTSVLAANLGIRSPPKSLSHSYLRAQQVNDALEDDQDDISVGSSWLESSNRSGHPRQFRRDDRGASTRSQRQPPQHGPLVVRSVDESTDNQAPSFTHPVHMWSVRETANWLASLGRAYHQYCHEFVESAIDGNMLLEICRDERNGHQYLKELGVKTIHAAKVFFGVKQRLAAAGEIDGHPANGDGGAMATTYQSNSQQFPTTPNGSRHSMIINTPSRFETLCSMHFFVSQPSEVCWLANIAQIPQPPSL